MNCIIIEGARSAGRAVAAAAGAKDRCRCRRADHPGIRAARDARRSVSTHERAADTVREADELACTPWCRHSRGGECFPRTEAVFERHAAAMKTHGIGHGYLLSTHGPSGVGIETLIRWSDAPYPIHIHFMSDAERAKLKTRAANPDAARAVAELSHDILAEWRAIGGVHMQIGRKYPYLETRLPQTAAFLLDLKKTLDPDGTINPGNLFDLAD